MRYSFRRCCSAVGLVLALLALLSVGLSLPVTPVFAADPPLAIWRDTGLAVEGETVCFDATRADTVYVDGAQPRLYSLQTGEQWDVGRGELARCSRNGLLFIGDYSRDDAYRYSIEDPIGRSIEHYPTHIAIDGSRQVYALFNGQLWASSDGGLSWLERGQQFAGNLFSMSLASADGRVIYAVVVTRKPEGGPLAIEKYAIYYSPDAGATWELRSERAPASSWDYGPALRTLASYGAPQNLVVLDVDIGPHSYSTLVSTDGGRTFNAAGDTVLGGLTDIVYADGALVRLTTGGDTARLARSTDGSNWQELPQTLPIYWLSDLSLALDAPANLLVQDQHSLWYSPDGGQRWERVSNGTPVARVSPYVPLRLVQVREGRLFVANLPLSTSRLTAPTLPIGGETGFSAETGHNIVGVFQRFWQQNGGLPQFGLPRTEAFYEVNETNGRVYLVQYFERNRFEYHPELAGTASEVQLSLLGSMFTAERRAAGEAAFRPVPDPQQPDVRFFAETGHTLSGSFLRHWEQNGGLSIYGFPISEAFTETNKLDSTTSTVQYFERNRFEYHPDKAGTPAEVQLSLLGNALLRLKGWVEDK